jgi:glycosyltransferase involved in cell wall biosynthesis
LIWHLHDILDRSHFAGPQRRLVTWLANRFARFVIVPSLAAATAFVLAGGQERRVRIVPNGLDILRPPVPREEIRRMLGLPGGFMFGVFSRLSPWKGQHVALEALSMLPWATCLIVGDAQFGETDYATELRRLAGTLGVAHRVRFLGHRDDIPALMHAVDAVVHPSVDPEPFGRTLIEAMLLHRPVIATDAGAAPEILDGGRCGELVPPRGVLEIVAALNAVRDRGREVDARVELAASRARTLYHAARMRADVTRVLMDTTFLASQ